MATHYSSGQYEDSYVPRNLQNWSLPRQCKQRPSAREGFSQFIADDRGHLLPSIPRSNASPWGTYMGTWDMPLKIPPAKVCLTSRSVAAATQLTKWIDKSKALGDACNGLVPQIIGEPSDPKETPTKASRPPSKGSPHPDSAKMPAQEEIRHSGASTPPGPLSRQPGCIDVRFKEDGPLDTEEDTGEMKEGTNDEIPLSRQPGSMDVRLKDTTVAPKAPALSRCSSREPTPRRAVSADAPPSSRPRSLEGKAKGFSTPELLAAHRPGSMEANHKSGLLAKASSSSRLAMKGSPDLEVLKTPTGVDVDEDWSESPQMKGSTRPLSGPEPPSC